MLETIKRLGLGLFLIAVAAGVLLYTDRGARKGTHSDRRGRSVADQVFNVAVVQHASLPVLEDGANGIVEALAERGYVDGKRIHLKRFNAEADVGTANAIAKEVTSGGFDLIVSVSTLSMQSIANANKVGSRTPHVFGLVTDPYNAGVGIDPTNHAIHPPYMTGYGCMQPVEESFLIAREMRPELKSVGLVWNPTEANSVSQTKIARAVCERLGIALVEANAENSTSVREAASSLVSRGVEALWISGDVTISLASDSILEAARRGRIPVFTVMPPTVKRGALFDLGSNYFEIGREVGKLAADVLDGGSPANIPVENLVPEIFVFNDTVIGSLKDRWTIPDDARQRADGWITATETNLAVLDRKSASSLKPEPGKTYTVGIAYFAPESGCDSCMKGIFDGLRELGFEEGSNLVVRKTHAQGEIANIPLMLQNLDSSDVDLILPMSTPVISGACGLVKHKPVVFTYCSDPVAAGAGKSFTNHLPHVTGIGSFPPVQDMVDFIKEILPEANRIGTIYNASEANSVKVIQVARGVFAAAGLKLDEVTVPTSADVLQAAQALSSRQVDAIYIQGDNTVAQAFEAVMKVARDAKMPVLVDDPELVKRGALACVGLGYYQPGYAAAGPVAQVLLGQSPADIPIENVSVKTVRLDLPQAERLGLRFPKAVLDAAAQQGDGSRQTGGSSPLARKAKVDLIEYLDTPNGEINREGILAGFERAGLRRGLDFELRIRNAQGDMASLNTIVDACISDDSDLLLTASTPALQAAMRRAKGLPVVFSLVASPIAAGAGRTESDHLPFLTGAYLPEPHEKALLALRKCIPDVKRIGTLFVPAEVNSVYYKDDLIKVAARMGIEVEVIGVNSSAEVSDAALALCGRPIDVVCQISDNLTGAGYASIVQAAHHARLPLMGFASTQTETGAFMSVSRDIFDGGVASAEMVARVLRGEDPKDIPFHLVTEIKYTFNPVAAREAGVDIPADLLRMGETVD